MKKISLVFMAALFTLVVVGAAASHAPITILGDSDFTADNGVLSGSGTADDPYVIAGWEITIPNGTPYGVNIQNTTAHFVLRGLVIQGASDPHGAAIHLGFVSGARVEGCSINNSLNGIEIASSTDVTLTGNVIYVQGLGLRVTGETPEEYDHAIDTSNVLNDSPIHYFYGRHGETISGIKGTSLYIAASDGMTIENNEIVNGDGIQLAFVNDSIIRNNQAYRKNPVYTEHGLTLYRSDNNTVTGNILKNNRFAGVYLWLSNGNELFDNQLLANNYGVLVSASDKNSVHDNLVFANPTGIQITGGSTGNSIARNIITQENTKYGVAIERATGNEVVDNAITDAETGVYLGVQADHNTVSANTIVAGAYGVEVIGSYNDISRNLISQQRHGILFPETYGKRTIVGNSLHENVLSENDHNLYLNHDSRINTVYGNYFLGTGEALVEDYGKGNTWTHGGKGNYWETYTGTDANGDGIGDTPMTVYPSAAQDTAPLVTTAGATVGLGILGDLSRKQVILTTGDGTQLKITALVADAGYSRFIGFRGYPPSLRDLVPAILFMYDKEFQGNFVMDTVHFPLDIAFFDKDGRFAGGTTMAVYSEEDKEKKLYTAKRPFQYALELPEGYLSAHGIGEGTVLTLPEE